MRHFAMTGISTTAMISRITFGEAMRATPPSARICAGTRSRAITATAPARSAISACFAVVTSMITPPLSISARPVFRRRLVVCPLFCDISGCLSRSRRMGRRSTGSLVLFYSVVSVRDTFRGARRDTLRGSIGDASCLPSLQQSFYGGRQVEDGIGERVVAHRVVGKDLFVVAASGDQFGCYQSAAKALVVVNEQDGNGLRGVVGLKAVAGEQSGLHVVELIVVFAPVGGAVQPITGASIEIGDAGQVKSSEVVGLVQWVLQVGITAGGFNGGVFIDARLPTGRGPRDGAVKSVDRFRTIGASDLKNGLKRLGIRNEGSLSGLAGDFDFSTDGFGLDFRNGVSAAEGLLVAVEYGIGGSELRRLRPGRSEGGENANRQSERTHAFWTGQVEDG